MTDMDEEQFHTPSTGAEMWEKTKHTGYAIMLLVCLMGASMSLTSLWHIFVSPIAGLPEQTIPDSWIWVAAFLLFTTEAWAAAKGLHGKG